MTGSMTILSCVLKESAERYLCKLASAIYALTPAACTEAQRHLHLAHAVEAYAEAQTGLKTGCQQDNPGPSALPQRHR